MTQQTDSESTQTGFFSRLGAFLKRLLLAFLKLGLLLVILAALAGIAWIIYTEIDRSFDNVTRRIEINRSRIDLAGSDIDTLMTDNDLRQEQVTALQTAVASQDAYIATLESELIAGQEQQDQALDGAIVLLEEQLAAIIASTGVISSNVSYLNDGLVSLQRDTTTNVSDIDAVGGEVDALQIDLIDLNGELDSVQVELGAYSADEFNRMRQALALFQVWEMVSRARLRLIEQNIGLAAGDINSALISVDRFLGNTSEVDGTTEVNLEQVQERLILAASNLPDDPDAAARDLDTTWELLDNALAGLFEDQSLSPQESATPEPTTTP